MFFVPINISIFISSAMGSASRSQHSPPPPPPYRSQRTELLWREIDVAARRDLNTHSLVDDVDAREHIHGVVVIGDGDAEHVDVAHAVVDLHTDNDMSLHAARGSSPMDFGA